MTGAAGVIGMADAALTGVVSVGAPMMMTGLLCRVRMTNRR